MHRPSVPVAAAGLLLMVLALPRTAIGQEATPPIALPSFPLTPDASLCTTAPRPIDELVDALLATPSSTRIDGLPTEVTVPLGQPADDAIVDAITRTILEYHACLEAGGLARASGLVTDDVIARFGPWPSSMSRTDMVAFLETPAWHGPGEEAPQLVAITDVMQLEDGRAGAFLVTTHGDRASTVYLIFEQHGERWLMDDGIQFLWYLSPSDDE